MSRKLCGKRRKCWLPAFSPFPTMFSMAFVLLFRVVKSRYCVVETQGQIQMRANLYVRFSLKGIFIWTRYGFFEVKMLRNADHKILEKKQQNVFLERPVNSGPDHKIFDNSKFKNKIFDNSKFKHYVGLNRRGVRCE